MTLAGLRSWLFPPPHPNARAHGHVYAYEAVGHRADGSTKTLRYDSPRKAYREFFHLLGGYRGAPAFDWISPLERIDLGTGERCMDFPER